MKVVYFLILIIFLISCADDINYKYEKIVLPPLKVVSVKLENNMPDMTSYMDIEFNTKVSRSSVYRGISCSSGTKNAFMYMYIRSENEKDTVRLMPFYPLVPYVLYTCKVSKEVTDILGKSISEEYIFKFKPSARYFSSREFNPDYHKFDNVYKFLQRRCTECHNDKHKLNFKVSKSELYSVLINEGYKGRRYIVPFDIENSYLINKLMGVNFYGDKMPPDLKIPVFELEKTVGWVKLGAKYEEN